MLVNLLKAEFNSVAGSEDDGFRYSVFLVNIECCKKLYQQGILHGFMNKNMGWLSKLPAHVQREHNSHILFTVFLHLTV